MIALNLKEIFRSPIGSVLESKLKADFVSEGSKVDNAKATVSMTATIRQLDDGILMDISGNFSLPSQCDRCLKAIKASYSFASDLSISNSEILHLKDYQFPLDQFLNEQLILSQPIKELCQPKCRGLCPVCGSDKNKSKCKCPDIISKNNPFSVIKEKHHGPTKKKN